MMSKDYLMCDSSWTLRIFVTDLEVERSVRVKSDSRIGCVMLNLAKNLDIAMNWSDHALWWPERNIWLTQTRFTLDQYNIQEDAVLHFTSVHKTLRVQLPDLSYLDCRVDFSIKMFNVVIQLCKELGIRYPEELSFCKPLEPDDLKYNIKNARYNIRNKEYTGKNRSGYTVPLGEIVPSLITRLQNRPRSNGEWSNKTQDNVSQLSYRPMSSCKKLLRPKSLLEKARMNVAWLDSSLSLMEQGIQEFDILHLKFKYYSFYNLNPKIDTMRIDQIYEQAKWQLLNDELDCTEEEAFMFAALQVQISLKANISQPLLDNRNTSGTDEDIDTALSELQVSLEGSHICSCDITQVPELYDFLRFLKPKHFTFKVYKRYWFIYSDLKLRLYKTRENFNGNTIPIYDINLKGCKVTPDVCLIQRKFGIKIEFSSAETSEMLIRCDTEEQYVRWMAACSSASKGRSLAHCSYKSEVSSITNFLQMQHPAQTPILNPSQLNIIPKDYLPLKFIKRLKKTIVNRILKVHSNLINLSLLDAKLNYIKAWQSLSDFGISFFIVKFDDSKKDELLGLSSSRIIRLDITGDLIKSWEYNIVKSWKVTRHTKDIKIQFDKEKIEFSCLSVDCKVIHEFIGGYIFLSMRSKEGNQTLNKDLFYKLTGN